MSDIKSRVKAAAIAAMGLSSMAGNATEVQSADQKKVNIVQNNEVNVSHADFLKRIDEFVSAMDKKNKVEWSKEYTGVNGYITIETGKDTLDMVIVPDLGDGDGKTIAFTSKNNPDLNIHSDNKGLFHFREVKTYKKVGENDWTDDDIHKNYLPKELGAKIERKLLSIVDNCMNNGNTKNLTQEFLKQAKTKSR